jgi:hypothetical protein
MSAIADPLPENPGRVSVFAIEHGSKLNDHVVGCHPEVIGVSWAGKFGLGDASGKIPNVENVNRGFEFVHWYRSEIETIQYPVRLGRPPDHGVYMVHFQCHDALRLGRDRYLAGMLGTIRFKL